MAKDSVVVVGTGTMGREHTAAWRAIGLSPACIVGNAERAAALLGNAQGHVCEPVSEAMGRHRTTAIVDVCTPTDRHLPCLEAIGPGPRLVIMEKPLAATLGDAQHLVRIAQALGVRLFPAQLLRFDAGYRALHDRAFRPLRARCAASACAAWPPRRRPRAPGSWTNAEAAAS